MEVKVSDEKNEKNELQNKVEELENKLMETKLVEEVGYYPVQIYLGIM